MVATATMLNKSDVVAYVGENAYRYGLDPAAVLAVANGEGLKTDPGSSWTVPGEPLPSFGPPSWYAGGAGADIVQKQGSVAAAAHWAWTPAGIDYWLQSVANSGASGLSGPSAIETIVKNFERPAAQYISGNIRDANNAYQSFVAWIQQFQISPPQLPPIPLPGQPHLPGLPGIPIPGQTSPGQLPTPTNPETPAPGPSATSSTPFSMHLFSTPFGPVNMNLPWDFSGILLFLAAIFAIIIGALLWDKSRNVIIRGGETAAMAGV